MKIRALLAVACCTGAVLVPATAADAAAHSFPNCKTMNKTYPHGVGKVGTHDRSKSKSKSFKPVTNFKRSNAIYAANVKRDGDGDKVACEKH